MSTDMAVKDISQFELKDRRTPKQPLRIAVKDRKLGNPIITVGKQWQQFYAVPFEHVPLIPGDGEYAPGVERNPDPQANLFTARVKSVVMGKRDEDKRIQYVAILIGKVVAFGQED